ncbi:MAG TPA: DUF1905 domain-containing protein [Actinocrinis sp.]|uniref:DUF1905 domain-containing protein n=1 Tax=Actinocrinis sp. TaxID=1920516 RepID=UPI002D49D795|nr:DUF1905 domain-containing protein [Actinocrinis sp.]HZU56805.1 DUF1905 domain-containing protein [Actinocrinis sp.]
MEFAFTGEIWHWRGPSPFHFVTVPEEQAADIQALAADVTYGWGMIPVRVRLGGTAWKTSLFPKDGGYVLPLKDSVRRAESVELGDMVEVELTVLGG